MKKLFAFSLLALMCFFAAAQTVTFTGRDASSHYVQLNRVVVTNLTNGWQETLFWPDTALTMESTVQTGITGIGNVETRHGTSLQSNQ